jgi:hypothetical protein
VYRQAKGWTKSALSGSKLPKAPAPFCRHFVMQPDFLSM